MEQLLLSIPSASQTLAVGRSTVYALIDAGSPAWPSVVIPARQNHGRRPQIVTVRMSIETFSI